MKTTLLRTSTLAALFIASTAVSFAAPKSPSRNNHRYVPQTEKAAITAPSETQGDRMLVRHGKRTSFVRCTNTTAKCKAHCAK